MTHTFDYDIIVVGGGHAGCEAAAAAATLGSHVLLITHDMNKIAQMSCNPAMGGIAKGQIVREIDALGGLSGIVSDASSIQFRMLNRSKGPAMWSPRAQIDRMRFMEQWRQKLDAIEQLDMWQDSVLQLIFDGENVVGVETALKKKFYAPKVILTVGTFLGGLMHFGSTMLPGGRVSEPASYGITDQLIQMGFVAGRMKTGTPARIDGRSVDWSLTTLQEGDAEFNAFSFLSTPDMPRMPQLPCHILYTNEECHEILRGSLDESPLYNGQIDSIGPRYCPSIETKIVTFADKTAHQLFLEPEGAVTNEYYLNGFSSSLPMETQIKALKSIPALRNVRIYRPGYAIEYDYFDPTQLQHTLETKQIAGLYFAGQINGTTGYEEAAGQGLIAGINAHNALKGREPFILGRNEAYIGVLIDDLVTKGVDEPYRMFTSRAEFRTLLRQDNADERLTPKAIELGLASAERIEHFTQKQTAIQKLIAFTSQYSVKPELVNSTLEEIGEQPLKHAIKLREFLLRTKVTFDLALRLLPEVKAKAEKVAQKRKEVIEASEIAIKYAGYIEREKLQADKMVRLENIKLGDRFDYLKIESLSTEARQKLDKIRPITIGQAARIPGVSPHDISILIVLCQK
ncbi:tRNA uridine 5-carboxymethylaminomethyl modification protein [Porphyromonas gingivicanis]|uniref:tRNA uridine 5-carboxymethylaminomethyl modification enzyme MnmG n=1 Tax=Porphyromonas gingivicanis TaxID=266762 RepID=A0A0A2G5R7_9PORP|nr:tRNA uridine-5-carboxymethylaminomethyl(34) synthesis enzyme MnmG [Porphyromonas gingivicanis]KGN97767.1 tRNA uridine 5-carboxymethylaminomethyl modification protein [Porphyromonas gingivicanis]